MKKYTLFACLIGVLALTGCTTFMKNNDQTNTAVTKEENSQDYRFDLNINSLSYQLPSYTKICTPETRYDCSVDGCKKSKPVVFVLYDENSNKVYRCDKKPCDEYDVSKDISGLFTNLTPVTPNGSFVKLSEDNEYVETATIGLSFVIQRGQCTDKK